MSFSYRSDARITLLALSLLALSLASPADATPFNATDPAERITCQRTIERVYHQHRLWPEENRGVKPSFERAVPEAGIAERARDTLLATRALEELYQDAPGAEELQRELDRIAAETRRPEMLQELFDALGNDPARIAECLARPNLAERRLYEHFLQDARIHGETERTAREDLAGLSATGNRPLRPADLTNTRGDLRTVEWLRADVDDVIWRRQLDDLAALYDATSADVPLGRASKLLHGETRYSAVVVTERSDDRLLIQVLEWPRRPFDDWWREARRGLTPATPKGAAIYRLPTVGAETSGASFDGEALRSDFGDPDAIHQGESALGVWTPTASIPLDTEGDAVWTGTEMVFYPRHGNIPFAYDPAVDRWEPRNSLGSPGSRREFSMIWTGTEVIVFAGCLAQNHRCAINSGARYNPTLDIWNSMTPGPEVITLHDAVWSGTEMLVWGGCRYSGDSCSINPRDGARYDPVSDSWAPITDVGAPPGHTYPRMVWTGDEMIVWNGTQGGGGRYDPATDSWRDIATENAPPGQLPAVVWTGDRMIAWGGCVGTPQCFIDQTTGGRYDPDTDTWEPTSQAGAPAPRVWEAYVWSGTEMLIWGGANEDVILGDGARYDPVDNSWTPISEAGDPIPRRDHVFVWAGDEMIVWGGTGYETFQALRSGGRYDPATDSWRPTSRNDPFSFRSRHTAVWTGTEMLAWGGLGDSSVGPLNTGRRYDPATATWAVLEPNDLPASATHTMIWTGNVAIIWGGDLNSYNAADPGQGSRYNPATRSWSPTSIVGAPTARTNHSAVWTGSEMIVWGGLLDTEGGPGNGGRYDPASDSWAPVSTDGAPSARWKHSAVWADEYGEMIVFGGGDAYVTLGTGGRYDLETDTWKPLSMEGAPSPRTYHGAVWTGELMLIWGGVKEYPRPAEIAALGHRYDPFDETWSTIESEAAPKPRGYQATLWTGAEMIVYGGCLDFTCIELYPAGGHYDPETNTWKPIEEAHAPERRGGNSAVWTGEEMLIWGGNARFTGITGTGGLYTPAEVPAIFIDNLESGDFRRWRAVGNQE